MGETELRTPSSILVDLLDDECSLLLDFLVADTTDSIMIPMHRIKQSASVTSIAIVGTLVRPVSVYIL